MYFMDSLKVLLRRWYVVATGILVVGGLCFATIKIVPTDYEASGQMMMLLPPTATGVKTPTNPYLNLQPGLSTTASLIAGTVMSKDSQRALKKQGYTSDYAVGLVPDNGPLLLVSSNDTSPATAVATRDAVMDMLDRDLAKIQGDVDVPSSQLITLNRSNVGTRAEAVPGSKIRALIAVTALGMVITLLLAFLADRIAVSRSRRRAEDEEDDPEEELSGVATLRRHESLGPGEGGPGPSLEQADAEERAGSRHQRRKRVGSGGRP